MNVLRWKKFFLCLVVLPVTLWANSVGEVQHYEASWTRDVPLGLFSAFASAFGYYRYHEMEVRESGDYLESSDLLPWDRPLAGRYNESADKASKWLAVLGVAPLVLEGYSYGVGDATGKDVASFTLMFAEALALQNGINLWLRSLEFWPRPYIYATDGAGKAKAEKAKGEAYGSFFSGHASAAFTVATFTGEWFSEFYPQSPYRGIVWALALSAAGFESVLRVAAGKHYWSDVAVGSLVGVGISFAVINVHKCHNGRFSFWAGFGSAGISVRV